jgi:putative ABC transport system permease protein
VAGVLPPALSRGIFTDVDFFVARRSTPRGRRRDDRRLFVFGRLRPGATIDQASAELSSIAADLSRRYPATNAQTGAVVRPLLEQLGGNIAAIVGIMAFIARSSSPPPAPTCRTSCSRSAPPVIASCRSAAPSGPDGWNTCAG